MSDNIEELAKQYKKHVSIAHYPRSIGLFPIPEYPELEAARGMWSSALDAILTTLRYLAPATLLTLFWGQQSFLFKLLKHIDSAFRAIVFSSEEQKQAILTWLAEAGPVRVESLDTVWRHGWIVCGVLDAALPGACAGHPPTRLSLKHAQAIADHYLGVEPVFSRQELDTNDSLSKHQEWKLATYLDRIRLSLAKLTPAVSKPGSQRTSPETTQFTLDYVARGSGLAAAQIRNKMYFKIYPTSQQSLDPGEITILIRGPKDTYGMTVLPAILGKAQQIRQKLLGLQSKPNYTENVLPITHGATYLRSYGKNDMNKTYYIPKTKYDIEIEADTRADHTKISYQVNIEGRYEISITSRGQSIVGSPFPVIASSNILNTLERESFCLEDGEEIGIVDIKTDRKVVLRIVDFVTEKMLLKENGSLEKITEDEAKMLMSTDKFTKFEKYDGDKNDILKPEINTEEIKIKSVKFTKLVEKVIIMNQVCKLFNELLTTKKKAPKNNRHNRIRARSTQDIPDIVNSTFSEVNVNPFAIVDTKNKYIIPENISVSLKTEKPFKNDVPDNFQKANYDKDDIFKEKPMPGDRDIKTEEIAHDDLLLEIPSSPNNPFLMDTYGDTLAQEKILGTFVTSEYETNNSQNEVIPETPIKILLDEIIAPPPNPSSNPFVDKDIALLERPKTPVYKIITGEVKNRDDSVYIDPKTELQVEEILSNEFINPLFMHQHMQSEQVQEQSLHVTDFIIGAPVSLPPVIRASSPNPTINSLIVNNNKKYTEMYDQKQTENFKNNAEESMSVFSTPLHTVLNTNQKVASNSSSSSTFQSLDSENIEIIQLNTLQSQLEPYENEGSQSDRNLTPKKEIWDSAYVSIDENNSSPDSNNNDSNIIILSKQKPSHSDDTIGLKREDLINMGPAERELWQSCNELKDDVLNTLENAKVYKWDLKRPMFTPIIEESDRSISSGMKDISRVETSLLKIDEADSVTKVFTGLNDLYSDFETEFTMIKNEDSKLQSLEVDNNIDTYNNVDSASETITDVKRHTNELEGTISEVQANVTESVSVSQHLQREERTTTDQISNQKYDETQFGDAGHNNIVLEKKKYWDERIRQIEAKSQESMTQQKKRRLSSKYLRHNDSLTKRRGKQIVKKLLSTENHERNPITSENASNEINQEPNDFEISQDDIRADVKLVDKWKKYWDEKLETETEPTSSARNKSPKNRNHTSFSQECINNNTDIEDTKVPEIMCNSYKEKTKSLPVKQELPEEVFKAFETSPKRFFGTSRKQILNKIDTSLGKPSTVDEISTEESGAHHDSGLVSSRVFLFHSISQTEEKPWPRRKCQSMHDIFQRKDSSNNIEPTSLETKLNEIVNNKLISSELKKPDAFNMKKIDGMSSEETVSSSLKEKRSRIGLNVFNKSFDETVCNNTQRSTEKDSTKNTNVQRTVRDINKQHQYINKYKKVAELRRKSFSKSEMDIFNKAAPPEDDGLDKYKSCDELPKINIKNFISLFESVSKTSIDTRPIEKINKINTGSQKHWNVGSSHSGAVHKSNSTYIQDTPQKHSAEESITDSTSLSSRKHWSNKSFESLSSVDTYAKSTTDSIDIEIISNNDKETTHLSLSDIELEIVESSPDKSSESSPKHDPETTETDYRSRFKMAKDYFKSLEELRAVSKKSRKINECEKLLQNKSAGSTESLDENRPKRRVKRNIKAHSMPSSEISKIWNQLQENQENEASTSKLVKISEKFNVDDLFIDVMEGRLSRQGSLRGIPHKKAVLEAFRSMENIADSKMSPYEIAVSQLNEFAKENHIKNAQTYLTEYPYLPTTDPSKYHSRLDAKASGLISLKEIIDKKPRRNSVPDLRLNPSFTVDL